MFRCSLAWRIVGERGNRLRFSGPDTRDGLLQTAKRVERNRVRSHEKRIAARSTSDSPSPVKNRSSQMNFTRNTRPTNEYHKAQYIAAYLDAQSERMVRQKYDAKEMMLIKQSSMHTKKDTSSRVDGDDIAYQQDPTPRKSTLSAAELYRNSVQRTNKIRKESSIENSTFPPISLQDSIRSTPGFGSWRRENSLVTSQQVSNQRADNSPSPEDSMIASLERSICGREMMLHCVVRGCKTPSALSSMHLERTLSFSALLERSAPLRRLMKFVATVDIPTITSSVNTETEQSMKASDAALRRKSRLCYYLASACSDCVPIEDTRRLKRGARGASIGEQRQQDILSLCIQHAARENSWEAAMWILETVVDVYVKQRDTKLPARISNEKDSSVNGRKRSDSQELVPMPSGAHLAVLFEAIRENAPLRGVPPPLVVVRLISWMCGILHIEVPPVISSSTLSILYPSPNITLSDSIDAKTLAGHSNFHETPTTNHVQKDSYAKVQEPKMSEGMKGASGIDNTEPENDKIDWRFILRFTLDILAQKHALMMVSKSEKGDELSGPKETLVSKESKSSLEEPPPPSAAPNGQMFQLSAQRVFLPSVAWGELLLALRRFGATLEDVQRVVDDITDERVTKKGEHLLSDVHVWNAYLRCCAPMNESERENWKHALEVFTRNRKEYKVRENADTTAALMNVLLSDHVRRLAKKSMRKGPVDSAMWDTAVQYWKRLKAMQGQLIIGTNAVLCEVVRMHQLDPTLGVVEKQVRICQMFMSYSDFYQYFGFTEESYANLMSEIKDEYSAMTIIENLPKSTEERSAHINSSVDEPLQDILDENHTDTTANKFENSEGFQNLNTDSMESCVIDTLRWIDRLMGDEQRRVPLQILDCARSALMDLSMSPVNTIESTRIADESDVLLDSMNANILENIMNGERMDIDGKHILSNSEEEKNHYSEGSHPQSASPSSISSDSLANGGGSDADSFFY